MTESTSDDNQWRSYRNYADSVTVAIKPVENLIEEDKATEDWIIHSRGAAWDQDWLVREVYQTLAAPREDKPPADHVLEVHEHHFSWGADAAVYEILMVLVSWAATSAAWDGTKALARTLQRKLDERADIDDARPISEDEARERAHWILTNRYKENARQLELVSIEIEPPKIANVTFDDISGWRYQCSLVLEGEHVVVGKNQTLLY